MVTEHNTTKTQNKNNTKQTQQQLVVCCNVSSPLCACIVLSFCCCCVSVSSSFFFHLLVFLFSVVRFGTGSLSVSDFVVAVQLLGNWKSIQVHTWFKILGNKNKLKIQKTGNTHRWTNKQIRTGIMTRAGALYEDWFALMCAGRYQWCWQCWCSRNGIYGGIGSRYDMYMYMYIA